MSHPHPDDLAALFDAVTRWRETLLHLLGCPQCAELAATVFAGAGCEAVEASPAADYDPVFERARAKAKAFAKARQVQIEEAGELLAELLAMPPAERAAALVTGERFHSVALAEALLAQARSHPAERAALTSLSLLLLEGLVEPRQEVRDLRAEAHAELADALRVAGHYQTAERELATAAADLRESSDPLCRAGFCRTLARLRYEQGRFDEAYALIDRAAELFEDGDAAQARAETCIEAGQWALGQGEPQRAAALFDLALAAAELAAETRGAVLRALLVSLLMDGRRGEAARVLHQRAQSVEGAVAAAYCLGDGEGETKASEARQK